jgi:hypothetical protein
VANPLRFIAEAQRAKRISQVARETEGSTTDWRKELADHGMVDLLGYEVFPPMIDSLAELSLIDLIGSDPRPVFIARFKSTNGAPDRLADSLRVRGFRVNNAVFGVSESWWFHSEFVSDGRDLIPATRDWLIAAIAEMA